MRNIEQNENTTLLVPSINNAKESDTEGFMSVNLQEKNNCLTCSAEISIQKDTLSGEVIECTSCGQEHEVIIKDGRSTLSFAPEIEEDWGE